MRKISAFAILVLLPLFIGAGPAWWTDRGVILPNSTADDYAAVNVGQVKNIATKAYEEMQAKLPGGAGVTLTTLVTGFSTTDNHFNAVTIGQLKNLAKPFYDRLIEVGYTTGYPWTATTADDDDYAMANIGQVKNLFSFDLSNFNNDPNDTDHDGLPDAWELQYFSDLNQGATNDYDGDGRDNHQEFLDGTNPTESEYRLTVNVAGNGSVQINDYGALKVNDFYAEGTAFELTPVPNAGYALTNWTGVEEYEIVDGKIYLWLYSNRIITSTFADTVGPVVNITSPVDGLNTTTRFTLDTETGAPGDSGHEFDQQGNYDAAKAFDNDPSTVCALYNPDGSWLKYDFGLGKTRRIEKYRIDGGPWSSGPLHGQGPKSWTLEGSNDDSNDNNWVVLDAQSNQVNWVRGTFREFQFTNVNFYRFYRLKFNYDGIEDIAVAELDLLEHEAYFETTAATIALSGTSWDVNAFTLGWTNLTAQIEGVPVGTSNWNIPSVPLAYGTNTIQVVGTDSLNNRGVDTLKVFTTYDGVEVSPVNGLDFGSVLVGTTTNLDFTITNTGISAFSGTVSLDNGHFSILGSTNYNIPPNGGTKITVSYSPLTNGTFTSTATFTGNGGRTRAITGSSPYDGNNNGLQDAVEYQLIGLDYIDDHNGDGIPDTWQITYFDSQYLEGGIYGPEGDPDGDGLTNYQEYRKGTNPMIPDFLLTLNTGLGGYVDGGVNGTYYPTNTVLTLTAYADVGSSFAGWSGSMTSASNPISLTMDSVKTVTASFQDVALPNIEIFSPANSAWIFASTTVLSGLISDNQQLQSASVDLNGTNIGNFNPSSTSQIDLNLPLDNLLMGLNTINITAVDSSSNTSTLSQTLMRCPPDYNKNGFGDDEEVIMDAAASDLTVVDHHGADMIVTTNSTYSGRHINVGTFMVTSGVTVTVPQSVGKLWVEAQTIDIRGIITAQNAGGNGGVSSTGGIRGQALFDAQHVLSSVTLAGSGANGSAASGNGGMAGSGGSAANMIVGYTGGGDPIYIGQDSPTAVSGNNGTNGGNGGYNGAGVNTDITIDYSLLLGGGGGSGGAGGGAGTGDQGSTYQSAGGVGGNGGAGGKGSGAIYLLATSTNSITGSILASGTTGTSGIVGTQVILTSGNGSGYFGGNGGNGGMGSGGGILLRGDWVNVAGTVNNSGGAGGTLKIFSGPGHLQTSGTLSYGRLYTSTVYTSPYKITEYDGDGDGITDRDETMIYHTNPQNLDTDGDGLRDGFEIQYGFNPLAANSSSTDSDGDGLTNLQEQMYGTNPNNMDSDGDGHPDGEEIAAGSDPDDTSDTPDNKHKIQVNVHVDDPDHNDDVWNIFMDDGSGRRFVVSNQGDPNFNGDAVIYAKADSKVEFTMERPEAGQAAGEDEYGLTFTRLNPNDNSGIGWVADPNNSPLSDNLPYSGNIPPDPRNLKWVYYTPKVEIAVDGNYNNLADLADPDDKTTAQKPYRFWINSDLDNLAGGGDGNDYGASGYHDYEYNHIANIRGLEDFAQLQIKVTSEVKSLIDQGYKLAIENDGCEIKVFKAAESGNSYLTDRAKALVQIGASYRLAANLSDLGASIKSGEYAKSIPFIFEGVTAGTGTIKLVLKDAMGNKIASSKPVYLKLQDIKDMYERASLGDGDGGEPLPLAEEKNIVPTDPNEAHQLVVFIHGINNSYWEYENTSETMFKRLWHQGYKGRFAALRWPCLMFGTIPDEYNTSEFIAFKSGLGTSRYLNKLRSRFSTYNISVAAHSMGNIVMAQALKEQKAGGFTAINNYVLMQGAVPAHCYDPNAPNLPMLTDQELVKPTPDTYRNYVGSTSPPILGTMVNFYNPDDFALVGGKTYGIPSNWQENERAYKPDEGLLYTTDGINAWIRVAPPLDSPKVADVTDVKEIMSFVARPRSKAVGGEGGAGNIISDGVNVGSFGLTDTRPDHSGQFTRSIQQLGPFYQRLKEELAP